jgi:hypothetical protein
VTNIALYDFPETASFLTEEERAFVIYRLKYQGQVASQSGEQQVAQAEEFDWLYVRQAFCDWQIWVNIFVYWGVSCDYSLEDDHPLTQRRLSVRFTALASSFPPSFGILATRVARRS